MMRINLLPVKAARKQVTARQEMVVLAGIAGVVVALLFAWWTVTQTRIGDMEDRTSNLRREIDSVQQEVKRVEEFKKKAETVERKLGVIDKLKANKTGPAKILDDLATILSDQKKVWLTKLDEKDGTLSLEGGAMEHENISDFQVALTRHSKRFRNVRLSLVSTVTKDGATYLEWKMTCATSYEAT